MTALDDGLLKHCWDLGDALGLHWEWELSSSQTRDHSVHMLWLPVALTLRMKTHSVELWEILLLGQSYSSCKDLDFFSQEDKQKLVTLKDNNDEQKINLKRFLQKILLLFKSPFKRKTRFFDNGKLLKCRCSCVLSS